MVSAIICSSISVTILYFWFPNEFWSKTVRNCAIYQHIAQTFRFILAFVCSFSMVLLYGGVPFSAIQFLCSVCDFPAFAHFIWLWLSLSCECIFLASAFQPCENASYKRFLTLLRTFHKKPSDYLTAASIADSKIRKLLFYCVCTDFM